MKNVKKLFRKIFSLSACALTVSLLSVCMNANAQLAGALDTSFNHTGKVLTTIGTFDQANAVAIQTDGKIVAVGSSSGSETSFALARYNVDGTLDNTFGTGGITTTYLGSSSFGST